MKTLSNYNKVLLGYNDNQPIYLSPPSWDCGWYWGFGYLGNKNCHYHLSGLAKEVNYYDGLKNHFGKTLNIRESDIWTFAELVKTAYSLKEMAEVIGRGGSHYTTNPCKDIITNKEEAERINSIVLPQIFEEIYKLLERNKDNKKLFKKLVSVDSKGDTLKIIQLNIVV